MPSNRELLSDILKEMKEQTELFKKMCEVMSNWRKEDHSYHEKQIGDRIPVAS